jgi:hypothetical protein
VTIHMLNPCLGSFRRYRRCLEERAVWNKTLGSSSKAMASSARAQKKTNTWVLQHHQGHRAPACSHGGSTNQMPAPLRKAALRRTKAGLQRFACFGFTHLLRTAARPRPLAQSRYKGTTATAHALSSPLPWFS